MGDDAKNDFLLLLDDHELRREGVKALIESWSAVLGLSIWAIAPDALQHFSGSARLVIYNLGGATLHPAEIHNTLAGIRDRFPETPCVILSDHAETDDVIAAADIGMQAFLTTAMRPEVVKQTLAFVVAGGTYFPREALLSSRRSEGRSFESFGNHVDLPNNALTPRQREVLDRLRHGKSNKHIARDLNMQEATVKVHVRQIMRKLGASNRTQAALAAQQAIDRADSDAAVPPAASFSSLGIGQATPS